VYYKEWSNTYYNPLAKLLVLTRYQMESPKNLPYRSAVHAWINLCSRYQPNTKAEKSGLKQNCSNSDWGMLRITQDIWLKTLVLIRKRLIKFKASVNEDYLI
jgi:hypothetical protein